MEKIRSDFALALLSAFAGAGNADDFCKHFVHKVLRRYAALGALIGLVGQDSKCHAIGKFGAWDFGEGAMFDLWSASPIAKAIKSGAAVHVETLEGLRSEFPETDVHLRGAGSYIYVPFEQTSRAVGFLGIGFSESSANLVIDESEIQMSALAAEYIAMAVHRIAPERISDSVVPRFPGMRQVTSDLSNRQMTILQMICEGKTNFHIGRNLSLSESTIKQETVRIFRKLGVPNRIEAADFAKRAGLI